MKKKTIAIAAGAVLLVGLLVFALPKLRRFIRNGTASIVYTPPVIQENVMHIACIGDSITYGAGVADADGNRSDEVTWPWMLEDHFTHELQVINYGVCGRTLIHDSGNGYTDTEYYRLSMDCGAETYLIMLGTNDSKEEYWNAQVYETELTQLVNSYISLPRHPAVFLMTPPCAFADEGEETAAYGIRNEVIRDEIVPIVKRVSETLGIQCLDLNAESQDHPEWFADGVHPNMEGNQSIAAFVYQNIRQ